MHRRSENSRRPQLVRRVRARLLRTESPRLQMALLVAATGAVGFVASALMSRLGVDVMWARYGLAVIVSYVAFLLFVWMWVAFRRRRLHADGDPAPDVPDLGSDADDGVETPADAPGGADVSVGFDVDEGLPIALVLVIVGSALIVSAYFIFTAPTFLAEILLDGVLSGALYRRLRRLDQRHWLDSAIRRTILPVLWVLATVCLAAVVAQHYFPEASTLGDLLRLAF